MSITHTHGRQTIILNKNSYLIVEPKSEKYSSWDKVTFVSKKYKKYIGWYYTNLENSKEWMEYNPEYVVFLRSGAFSNKLIVKNIFHIPSKKMISASQNELFELFNQKFRNVNKELMNDNLWLEFLDHLNFLGIDDEKFMLFLEGKVHRYSVLWHEFGWGVFPKLDDKGRIIDFNVLVPQIYDEKSLLINIHEYMHAYDLYQRLNELDDKSKDAEDERRAKNAEMIVLERRLKK